MKNIMAEQIVNELVRKTKNGDLDWHYSGGDYRADKTLFLLAEGYRLMYGDDFMHGEVIASGFFLLRPLAKAIKEQQKEKLEWKKNKALRTAFAYLWLDKPVEKDV